MECVAAPVASRSARIRIATDDPLARSDCRRKREFSGTTSSRAAALRAICSIRRMQRGLGGPQLATAARLSDSARPAEVFDTPEAQALYAWCREFERRCVRSMRSTKRVSRTGLRCRQLIPAERIALGGFRRDAAGNDAADRAVARCRSGWSSIVPAEHGSTDISVVAAEDATAELDLAAQWAREQVFGRGGQRRRDPVGSVDATRRSPPCLRGRLRADRAPDVERLAAGSGRRRCTGADVGVSDGRRRAARVAARSTRVHEYRCRSTAAFAIHRRRPQRAIATGARRSPAARRAARSLELVRDRALGGADRVPEAASRCARRERCRAWIEQRAGERLGRELPCACGKQRDGRAIAR